MFPTLPAFVEGRHTGEFLKTEASGSRSRENRTILAGSGILAAGTVLGIILAGAATAAAAGGNTGNGTISAVTTRSGIQPGGYLVEFVTATKFRVVDPDGEEVGLGQTGQAFAGPIGFTITAGGTAFVVGDTFAITVAPGSGKLKPANPNAIDGSAVAAEVLYHRVDATSVDVPATTIARDAEIYGGRLTFDPSVDSAPKRAAMIASLALKGLIPR